MKKIAFYRKPWFIVGGFLVFFLVLTSIPILLRNEGKEEPTHTQMKYSQQVEDQAGLYPDLIFRKIPLVSASMNYDNIGYAVSVSVKDSETFGDGDGVLEIPSYIYTEDGQVAVEAVDDYAFANCSNITEIVLPESIYSIGDFAFLNDHLTRLVMSSQIRYFGDGNNFWDVYSDESFFYIDNGIYYLKDMADQPVVMVGVEDGAYIPNYGGYFAPSTCHVVLSQAFKNADIFGDLDFTSTYMYYYGSEAFYNMDIMSGELKLSYDYEYQMPGGFGERIFNPTDYIGHGYDSILSEDQNSNLIADFGGTSVLISSLAIQGDVYFPSDCFVADGALIGIQPRKLIVEPDVIRIGENLFGHPQEYSLEYSLDNYNGINTLESIETSNDYTKTSAGHYAAYNNILYDLSPIGIGGTTYNNGYDTFTMPNYHKIVLGCQRSEFVEYFPMIEDPTYEFQESSSTLYSKLKDEYPQWLVDIYGSGAYDFPEGSSDLEGYYLTIGAGAFAGIDWAGKDLELPDEIAEIGRLAFLGTHAISIRVGAECEYIGYGAFSYTSIDQCVFLDDCYSGKDQSLAEQYRGEYYMPPTIAPCAFSNMVCSLVVFPETVTYIGDNCFFGAYIDEIVLPNENRSFSYDTAFLGEIFGTYYDYGGGDDGLDTLLFIRVPGIYNSYFQNADQTNKKYLTYEVELTLEIQSLNLLLKSTKLYNQSINFQINGWNDMGYGHFFNQWVTNPDWYDYPDYPNTTFCNYFTISKVDGLDIHDENTRLTNTRYNISEITLKSDSFNLMNKTYDGSVYQPSFSSSYVTRNLFDFEYYGEAPTVHENRLVAPTVAGTYTANLTFKDSLKTTYHEVWSWDSSVTGDIVTKKFTISPRAVEIKILNVEQTYGNQAKNYTLGGKDVGWKYVSSNHLLSSDLERSITFSTEAKNGYQSVGKYPITANFSDSNYTVTFIGDFEGGSADVNGHAGIFEIVPAEIGVTLGHSYVYQYGLNVSHDLEIKEEHLTFQGDVAFASAQVKYTALAEYHSGDEEKIPLLENFTAGVQTVSELGTYILFYCITAPNHKQKIDYAMVQVVDEVIEIKVDSEKMLEFVYGSQGITSDALIDLLYEKGIILKVFVERKDTSDEHTLGSVTKEEVVDAQNKLKQYAIFAIHDGVKDMTNQTLLWSSNYVIDVTSNGDDNGMVFDFYEDKNPKIKITPKELNLSDIDWQETEDENNPYEQIYNKGLDEYGHHHPNPIVTQKVSPDDQVLLSIQIYVRADHSLVSGDCAIDVGEYEVKIEGLTGSAAERYTLSTELKEASKELNILPRIVQMTWSGKNALYDGSYHFPTGDYNRSDILPGDEGSINFSITSLIDDQGGLGHINVGKYNYQATLNNKNYVLSEPSIIFEISKGLQEFELHQDGTIYGTPLPSASFTGDQTGGVTYLYERIDGSETYQSSVAPTDAGNYRLTVTLGETELYQASSQSVTFTISKAQADGSVEISSWTYGAVSSTPQATTNFGQVTILYSADGTTYTEEKPQNAGHYYIKAVVAGTSNYIGFEKIEEFDIYKACYLENEVEEPDFPETLTYTKGLSLENISLAENYRFADPNQVLFAGTQEITIYYNADPTNYENFAITKTITIAKGNYENMSYETITVTYKEGMTLADVGLSQGFRWEDDTTGLDIGDGQIFRAIYNDDSKNFNDYHLEIVLNVRGEIARNPLEGMEMGAFVLIASVEVLAMITMIVLVIRRRKRND